MRSFQYFPLLEEAGFHVEVSPLFSEEYLVNLYSGKSTIKQAVQGYLRRLIKIFQVGKFDRVVIEKELFPYLPSWVEMIFKKLGVHYIVDYDDAIFHNYDQSKSYLIRQLLGNKIGSVMKNSSMVVAGNSYLADYALKKGAKNIEVIPTVIDLSRYPIIEKLDNKIFTIGWIGTKSTFEKHLLPCREWIMKVQELDPEIRFHIIGVESGENLGKNVYYFPWTEETEAEEILKMDVGIMPLQDSLWERGKCAYKLIQYAACGVPGIASNIGMNREIIINGETGILAENDKQWVETVIHLKNNDNERMILGKKARAKVEKLYNTGVTTLRWIEILKNAP